MLSHPVLPTLAACDDAVSPRPPPCKVSAADPVAGAFVWWPTLAHGLSKLSPPDAVPDSPPTDTETRRDPRQAACSRQVTAVSDPQQVASLAVRPYTTATEYSPCPRPVPNIVRLIDPEAATFRITMPLMAGDSTVKLSDKLAPRQPDVTASLALAIEARAWRHLIDVSDSQVVSSSPVPPTLIDAVTSRDPSAAPPIVMLAEPVEPAFGVKTTDSCGTATEIPADRLPTSMVKEIATIRLPRTPAPVEHTSVVSDAHAVASHLVASTRPALLWSVGTRPCPCTVTDTEPVVTPLFGTAALKCPPSKDCAPDRLPVLPKTLVLSIKLAYSPDPTRDLTALSDAHSVPSHHVSPADTDPVYAASPSPAPCTVTLADPVDARFAAVIPDSSWSSENATDTLPAAKPAVTDTRLLCPQLWLARQLTVESLAQPVRSHPDCPADADAVCIALPMLAP